MQARVLVYNVKSFRRGVRAVAEAVAPYGPDIALLNECGPRRRLRRFARAMGMEAVAVHRLFRRSIHNAVLVRPPWRVVSHRLHRFPEDGKRIPRGVLIARVGRAGARLSVLSLHLGLHPGARRRNADELANLILSQDEPALAGGDLNETPDGKAVSWLAERFWDAWAQAGDGPAETFPAEDPTARIDFLFVTEHFGIERAEVLRTEQATRASDHLPLVADVSLSG